MRTEGKIHRHGLVIDIQKADGDHTILARMNESSTAYLPVYEQQAANAAHLAECWNAFEPDGIVGEMVEICKATKQLLDEVAEMNIQPFPISAVGLNRRLIKLIAVLAEINNE